MSGDRWWLIVGRENDWTCNEAAARLARDVGLEVEGPLVLESELDGLCSALQEIAERPVVELNPDGLDQAAHSMQLIAREALQSLTMRRRCGEQA